MALGEEIGEFSLKQTSATYAARRRQRERQLRRHRYAPRATVLGTLTARGEPGAKQGTCSWRAQGFLESGDILVTAWAKARGRRAGSTNGGRATSQISDGQIFASDGKLDLATAPVLRQDDLVELRSDLHLERVRDV